MGATALALPVRRGNRLYVDLASGPEDVRAAQALLRNTVREPESRYFGRALPASSICTDTTICSVARACPSATEVKIQPVALRFGTNLSPDPVAPFVGDDALLPHLARLIRHPGLGAQIVFLPPSDGSNMSRKQISEHCRSAIAAALELDGSEPTPSGETAEGSAAAVVTGRLVEAA